MLTNVTKRHPELMQALYALIAGSGLVMASSSVKRVFRNVRSGELPIFGVTPELRHRGTKTALQLRTFVCNKALREWTGRNALLQTLGVSAYVS